MKKKYLADLIDKDVYSQWLNGKKIIIQGPTGIGKSHFIFKVFVPYGGLFGKKVLILCNRKLLREQYHYDLAELYPRYQDMAEDVQVMTYQELAEKLKTGESIRPYLDGFDVLVFDETHFFYADSDFNALGTYVLLQALIKEAFFKSMIFLTATLRETYPLLKKTLHQCAMKMELKNPELNVEQYKFKGEIYDFTFLEDYSRFTCHFVPDIESLAEEISNSHKKTVVFIDDTTLAKQFRNLLIKSKKISDNDIFMLSSKILEEHSGNEIIRELAVANTLGRKVLITTSVLDNGVSIHDPEVGNVVIATESRVSFLQMIGRIRGEQVENCRLFIFPRVSAYYEKRVNQYQEKIQYFEKLEQISLQKKAFEIFANGWYGDGEKAEFLRNSIVFTKNDWQYYTDKPLGIKLRYPDPILAINAFAKEKTGNLLQAEKLFLRQSYHDRAAVARKQIEWIGKEPDELIVWDSSYREEREKKLVQELLKIQNFSLKEFGSFKEKIAKEFRMDVLEDIVLKDSSFSKDKFVRICEKFGLILEIGKNECGNNSYTVRKKGDD